MNSEWEVIIPPYLSYLLVLRVLWPEVTAHNLELHVEMGQPVEQIHPPWWRVVHYGRHPDPATCRLSRHFSNPAIPHTDTVEKFTTIVGLTEGGNRDVFVHKR